MGKRFKRYLFNEAVMGGVSYKDTFGKQCYKCKFANVTTGDEPDDTPWCDHRIFDGMPQKLADILTGWLFFMSEKNDCPIFKRGKSVPKQRGIRLPGQPGA